MNHTSRYHLKPSTVDRMIIEEPTMPDYERRSWRQRLFSRPWRPWRSKQTCVRQICGRFHANPEVAQVLRDIAAHVVISLNVPPIKPGDEEQA